jgi:hypothetical protein
MAVGIVRKFPNTRAFLGLVLGVALGVSKLWWKSAFASHVSCAPHGTPARRHPSGHRRKGVEACDFTSKEYPLLTYCFATLQEEFDDRAEKIVVADGALRDILNS